MMAMRPNSPLFACILAGLLSSTAFAQAINYTSVEAITAKPAQLSYHASAQRSSCTPAPLPVVRVVQPPTSGVLTVRRAILTTDKIAGCPQLKVPAQVVFYKSHDGYVGSDHVSYQVTDAKGESGTYDVTINVKAAPPPKAPGTQGGTSL
jgi:hypothetical protein